MRLSTHAGRMERWLGKELAEGIARKTRDWYGPPIPIAGVPGRVYARGGGDYVGPIRGGYFGCLADYLRERYKRVIREWARRQSLCMNTGFSSLSDLISEATVGGKMQQFFYLKSGVTGPAASACMHLWALGTMPQAGANAAAAPDGTIPDNTTLGGLLQVDPAGSDTLHLTNWTGLTTGITEALMLYDYLFGVNNSTNNTNTAITGVPTRYQGTNAAGSFCSGRVTTVMSATGTNFTLTYMDQDGNTAEAGAAIAGRASSAANTIPLTQPAWFIPLNSPDTGLRKMTNIQSSGANSGVVDWIIGHPLAILPMYNTNIPYILDGINSAFSLAEVKVDACLALMEYFKSATTSTNLAGMIQLVSG